MDFEKIFSDISAGLLVTDADFKVIWANKWEEDFYNMSLKEMMGLWVVDCHKEENKEKINHFLQKFKSGAVKEYTKTVHKMVITYSSYFHNGEFAGLVRTRINLPK